MESLSVSGLKKCAKKFPEVYKDFYGKKGDGKSIGTRLEKAFKRLLSKHFYSTNWGNSAKGVDLPTIDTDIKFSSAKHPQSSIPYKNPEQKVYGVGYNIILFVYKRNKFSRTVSYPSITYIDESRTGDFILTRLIRKTLSVGGNDEDIAGLLHNVQVPGDSFEYKKLIKEIMHHKPLQGYLTLSNALQWRATYERAITDAGKVKGIDKLYAK